MKKKFKQEIESLKAKREILKKELDKCNLTILGKEHPENAKKISDLETEKAMFDKQLAIETAKVNSLNTNILNLNKQISDIGSNKLIEKLFAHIRNKRWFFFENKKMFLFDKWSGMLWANLDNFTSPTTFNYKTAPAEIKKINWHNLKNWRATNCVYE